LSARWAFLPVLGAPLAHAPVLRSDLLPALKRPLDGGRTLRGRRLLGDNKTWRGAAFMFGGPLIAGAALHRWPSYRRRLPAELQAMRPVAFGAAIGAGTVLGELPNSFLKRQLDIAPGAQRRSPAGLALTVLDQGDLVLGIWTCLRPVYRMPPRDLAGAFALVSALHLAINVVGYAIGARQTAI
jgi:hypothetical protein